MYLCGGYLFKEIEAVFALLSILPTRNNDVKDASSGLWAFPFVGLVIGAISGGIGAVLIITGLEPLLACVASVAALTILTGLHHLDGLADISDALMIRGNRRRRIEALKDPAIGVGGVGIVILYMLALVSILYAINNNVPEQAFTFLKIIIAAEVIAKVSMIVMMRARKVSEDSSIAPFVQSAKSFKKVAGTIIIGAIIIVIVAGNIALVALMLGIIASLFIARLSEKNLGSLRGDAIGAANELSRLVAIITLVSLL